VWQNAHCRMDNGVVRKEDKANGGFVCWPPGRERVIDVQTKETTK